RLVGTLSDMKTEYFEAWIVPPNSMVPKEMITDRNNRKVTQYGKTTIKDEQLGVKVQLPEYNDAYHWGPFVTDAFQKRDLKGSSGTTRITATAYYFDGMTQKKLEANRDDGGYSFAVQKSPTGPARVGPVNLLSYVLADRTNWTFPDGLSG